jgi:hypothetical protein
MVIMTTEIFLADQQVMILVQLPELAVDDIEMFIREKVRYLVDVVLHCEPPDSLEKVALPKFRQSESTGPGPVDGVEYPRDDRLDISGVELRSILEEGESWMCIDDVLY